MVRQRFIQPATKEEYAYSVLRSQILNCERRPGEKLIMDSLGEELGTSPIPIRAALQRLQAEELVEIKPHSGATVAPLSPSAITELFTLSAALESIVMRVLAPKVIAADLARLQPVVSAMDEAADDGDGLAWSSLDLEFHTMLARLSGMALLASFASRTQESWLRLSRCYFNEAGPLRMGQANLEHQRMLELLAQHDGPALEALAVAHNSLSLQIYLATYRDLFVSDRMGE